MECSFRNESGVIVGSVSGRLDTATAAAFDQRCRQEIASNKLSVVLDLSELTYISSAGLRSLLVAAKTVSGVGKKIALSGAQKAVKDVLDLSGFSKTLAVYEKLEDAIAAVTK